MADSAVNLYQSICKKIPPHLNHVATLPCDISLITVHVLNCCGFSDNNISQGSVATQLKGGGIKRILKNGQYLAKLEAKIE